MQLLELEGEREMWVSTLTTRRQRRVRSLIGIGAVAVSPTATRVPFPCWAVGLPPFPSCHAAQRCEDD